MLNFFLNEEINYMYIFLLSDKTCIAVDTDDTDDEGAPQISLQEMLDDLHISGDATGEEGAEMID